MDIIVNTQYFENYNWNEDGDANPLFKAKGGCSYLLRLDDDSHVKNMIVSFYEYIISKNSTHIKEFPNGWFFNDADEWMELSKNIDDVFVFENDEWVKL